MRVRITVEVTEEQHRALRALAQQPGLRRISQLVGEALETYLEDVDPNDIDALLELEGIITATEEREMRARIRGARSTWRGLEGG